MSDAATEPKADKAIPTPKVVDDWSLRLQQAVLASAIYYKDRVAEKSPLESESAFRSLLSRKLSNSLASCVALHAGAYEDWSPDGTNVGYMVKIDGSSFLRAPVHLVPLIPERSYAEIVWRLTNEVRLSDTSIMALSGSNAVRRILQFVDDVDFFEYVSDEPTVILDRLGKRLLREGTSICERAKIGTTEFTPPYNIDAAEEAVRTLDPINDSEATIKVDYLTSLAGDRPFEVTNISGFVNKELNGPVKDRTFPFQEIVLSSKDSVPSQLDDPFEVGKYVCWLISEIELQAKSGKMLKAIKRALSLCRFCWFDDLLNDIHALFENTVAVHEAEIATTTALIERIRSEELKLSGVKLAELDWKLKELMADTASKKVKQDRYFPQGFDAEARSIIAKVRDRISDLSQGSLVDA